MRYRDSGNFPVGSRPALPVPGSSLHPEDGRQRLARPQRRPGLQAGGLQSVRLQREGLCRRSLIQVQQRLQFLARRCEMISV